MEKEQTGAGTGPATGVDPEHDERLPRVVNLTPHVVRFYLDDEHLVYPPSGVVARVSVRVEHIWTLWNKIPVVLPTYGPVEGLPDYRSDTILLVSRMVKSAVPNRDDCLVPDDVVRDAEGRILGCRRLCL